MRRTDPNVQPTLAAELLGDLPGLIEKFPNGVTACNLVWWYGDPVEKCLTAMHTLANARMATVQGDRIFPRRPRRGERG